MHPRIERDLVHAEQQMSIAVGIDRLHNDPIVYALYKAWRSELIQRMTLERERLDGVTNEEWVERRARAAIEGAFASLAPSDLSPSEEQFNSLASKFLAERLAEPEPNHLPNYSRMTLYEHGLIRKFKEVGLGAPEQDRFIQSLSEEDRSWLLSAVTFEPSTGSSIGGYYRTWTADIRL